jgi:hypothetical protein
MKEFDAVEYWFQRYLWKVENFWQAHMARLNKFDPSPNFFRKFEMDAKLERIKQCKSRSR